MMNCKEIEIPFKKSNRTSKHKKKIIKDGIKILVKSYFIYDKIQKNLNFTEEDEQEFMNSIELNNKTKRAHVNAK
ncbi:MAG: hypothetical protein HWN67_23000 [Candidatus Helarchaeota archaeon]|nr:hypothetical protein [Candidatus Helarchaeota archaeon]